MTSFTETAAQAVQDAADGKAVILDVRRDDEWNYEHAKGAVHFPVDRIEAGEAPEVPHDKRIYTYCQAGGRAGRAAAMLKDMGFSDVTNMGGLNDWRDAGGAVE